MMKKGTILITTFDEYTVQKQIAQGGNGTVFCVKNSDGEKLAAKAIDKQRTSKDKLKRFKNELAFCQNADDPRIMRVLDHGVFEQNIIFYVMPFYSMTLRDIIDNKDVTPEIALKITFQLLEALKYAHSKKVWHRDVKPENILIDDTKNVVLADFGIAHFCADELFTAIETKANDRLANYQYAAPEQRIKGSEVSGTSDIFAAGLILNEMFTGKVISGSMYEKISDSNPEWGYLDEIVDAMIIQDATQRIYPVAKILFQLEALAKNEKARQETEKLKTSLNESENIFEPIEVPEAIGAEYDRGILTIKLSATMPQLWFNVLNNGNFSHSSLMECPTSKFHATTGNDALQVTVGPRSAENLPSIIAYCKEWLPVVTQIFNREAESEVKRKKHREEEERRIAIEKIRDDEKIRAKLRSLF